MSAVMSGIEDLRDDFYRDQWSGYACQAITAAGKRCRRRAVVKDDEGAYCRAHESLLKTEVY